MACTAPLGAGASESGRRIVTIVFSDLVGSTALGESLDPEALREVLDRYFDAMRECIERYGGLVEKYIGDAIMAVFGLPRAHEDDALRATLAASAMRAQLASLNEELEASWGVRLTNRTGVHTGEVVTGDPSTGLRLVTGDAVNTAARLEQAAPHDEILLGEPTYRLVSPAATVEQVEPIAAKGKAEAVPAYLLRSVRRTQAIARHPTGTMIGRDAEIDRLVHDFRTVVEQRGCRVATVLGEPGVGKSRLVAELGELVASEARILSGRCLPYGEGLTYWPITEAIREAAGIVEDLSRGEATERLRSLVPPKDAAAIAARLATLIGLSADPFSSEEMTWAIRRFFEHSARDRPLLLVIDDVQWADQALIRSVGHLVDLVREGTILIVLVGRPELDEAIELPVGPGWSPPVSLEPLPDGAVDALVAQLLPGGTGDAALVERVRRAAQGNPLFVEQLVGSWKDLDDPDRDGPSADSGGAHGWPVPATLDALLRSRLDGLPTNSRGVVERGAVIGQVFTQSAVAALSDVGAAGAIDTVLAGLRRRRFVRPDVSPSSDDETWAFVHLLIRDTAYEGILKRTRVELHERVATWLQARAGDRLTELMEIVAHHLEQACVLRRELGPLDAKAEGLADRAVSALEESAKQASARFDDRSASRLLKRAADLRTSHPPDRFRLITRAMDYAMKAGEIDEAMLLRSEMASDPPDPPSEARLRSVEIIIAAVRNEAPAAQLLPDLQEACSTLRSARDVEGQILCLRRQATLLGWLGRLGESRAASLQSTALAREAGRTDLELDALAAVAMCANFDASPVGPTIELCRNMILEHEGDYRYRLRLTRPLATLIATQGDPDEARSLLDDLTRMHEELGMDQVAHNAEARVFVEWSAGDPGGVERVLRPLYDEMRRTGEIGYTGSHAALLAHAAIERGRIDEALHLSDVSRSVATPDDYDAQVGWRSARGLALAASGRLIDAETLLREAVAIVEATEDTNLLAETLLDLARAVEGLNRRDEAETVIDRAAELFEAKGSGAGIKRVERLRRSMASSGGGRESG
jgi:class 3 adenylate cyclase/tetratricopeptide (TPR) repeat protein